MIRSTMKTMAMLLPVLTIVGCDAAGGGSVALPGTGVLATFEPGATMEAVLDALPEGELAPSPQITETQLDHGYVVDDYFIDGQQIAVLWIHDPSEGLPAEGDPRTTLLPVVFVNEALDGSGWDHYDGRAAEWTLPDRWASGPPPTAPVPTEEGAAPDIRSF